LPGKVLADLCGKPVLRHVWERAIGISGVGEVVVLTESEKVQRAVESWGGVCHMTPETCGSGTERIGTAIGKLRGDYIFNVQGDEPFFDGELIGLMVQRTRKRQDFDVLTPIFPIRDNKLLESSNVVKVITDYSDRALYFSRCPVPFIRDCPQEQWLSRDLHRGHLGIYLYRREILEKFCQLPPSPLAAAESLEQLRLLQMGHCIRTIVAEKFAPAIDVPEDLIFARKILSRR
jgi:3-deoxy-manno-octulosonate cytidylyltransferase (CMP-KDO synthetase)